MTKKKNHRSSMDAEQEKALQGYVDLILFDDEPVDDPQGASVEPAGSKEAGSAMTNGKAATKDAMSIDAKITFASKENGATLNRKVIPINRKMPMSKTPEDTVTIDSSWDLGQEMAKLIAKEPAEAPTITKNAPDSPTVASDAIEKNSAGVISRPERHEPILEDSGDEIATLEEDFNRFLARQRVKNLAQELARELAECELAAEHDSGGEGDAPTLAEQYAQFDLTAPDEEQIPALAPQRAEQPDLAIKRPMWAQSAFECLLFRVSGLTMAIPLIELGGIVPLHSDVRSADRHNECLLGHQIVSGKSVQILNTSRLVMPERFKGDFVDGYKFLLVINGHDWGLAVDIVGEAKRFDPGLIRWRTPQGKRPWLAGTETGLKCALLSVDGIAEEFEKSAL